MKTPDYAYSEGLQWQVTDYTQHGKTESTEVVSPGAFRANGIDNSTLERLAAEISNPYHAKASSGGVERAIEYAVLNRDTATEGSAYVYHFGWGGNLNPLGAREAQMLGAMNPDKQFIVINSAGAGGTDRLPWSISREIAATGSYIPYGEFAVSALAHVFEGLDAINFRGNSEGARRSIGMAAIQESRDILVIDPVGVRKQSLPSLAKKFMVLEAQHSSQYVEYSSDELAKSLQRQNDSLPTTLRVMARMAASGALLDQFVMQPSALAKDGAGADLEQAAAKVSGRLVVINPELSIFDMAEETKAILARIALRYEISVQHRVLVGHTHNFGVANLDAFAYVNGLYG